MTRTISGYNITEKLYDSANSLVYRGTRQSDNLPVILKVLKEDYPSPERIAWFKREYEVTRNVNLGGVPHVYDLETDHHYWVIVQEDFGGESLRRLGIAGTMPLPNFLELAIRVTDILGQIHQQRIMHKDINPANIVFNPTTREVKFIDFGIATVLSQETPTFRNPTGMEGTLAYMSPEQAGRMNRSMDYRTDFYSLGITFYELLTGRLPFDGNDALEVVHSHIARQPVAPHEIKPDIPQTVSAIILKLMAKNAEDRYQSAYGVKADLETCLDQLHEKGRIDPFPPGLYDVSDRFSIPQKLYGREGEIQVLMKAFGHVSEGTCEMMLVSGYAGIGKSALVQELYKPITQQRGYFIAGKFDQFQRNIPYTAFIQAFRSLMRFLLTEDETDIATWKEKILKAVGNNGQVLTDVLPEVQLIIGPQPPVVELGPSEAQNRLNMVFQNFIKVFARSHHPLVIFLDDLQWADGASLKLLELLMTATDTHYLFVIGSYRDNEVGADHPLWLAIEAMKQAHATIHSLTLEPLDVLSVTHLIAETIHSKEALVRPLAELVVAKTGGNPFFLNEFFKTLYLEGLIHFDYTSGRWQWDLEHIQSQDLTDNVVDLMAGRVQRLNLETQAVLRLAACIGNQFDLETLAVVYEQTPRETAADLWEAVVEGLVLPLSDAYKLADLDVEGLYDALKAEYKFAHDRIQQAVYSLIPEQERQAVHWRIGSLLLERYPVSRLSAADHGVDLRSGGSKVRSAAEERIFDITNQLNQGRKLIKEQTGRDELAALNLIAGRKALASVAYESAFTYLRIGRDLLSGPDDTDEQGDGDDTDQWGDPWVRCYELTLTIHKEYAKSAYLNGQFEEAETTFDVILHKATTTLDKADIYNIKMILYTSQGKLQEVIDTGLDGLALLGLHLSPDPDPTEQERETNLVKTLLAGRRAADLLELPRATDPTQLMMMRLLADMLIPAWWHTNTRLLFLVTLKMVGLSLRYGNAEGSPFAYAWYGMYLGSGLGDYKSGYEFGELALHLNERFHAVHLVAKVHLIFSVFVHSWRHHLRESLVFARQGYQAGIESGDLVWAGINGYVVIYSMLIKGDDLDDVYQESQRYLDFARRTKQVIPVNMIILSQQFILCLKGLTRAPGSFSDNHYSEEQHIKAIKESEAVRPIFWYYKIKLQALYLFGQYKEALRIARELDALIEAGAAFGNVTMPEHYFYYSLTLAALYPHASAEEKQHYWHILSRNQVLMKNWAYTCPDNFRHKFLLVAAEIASLKGKDQGAKVFFEQAITSARDYGYGQNEALANELAARFFLAKGRLAIARAYLLEARNGYLRWGATTKVKSLDNQYPQLLAEARMEADAANGHSTVLSTTPHITTSSGLDLSTVIKASQAISGEMVLDTLLSKLMRIVLENAGAQRGALILERHGKWVIEAQGAVERDQVVVLQSVPLDASHKQTVLPLSIINYVSHTRESIVLNDASRTGQFTRDRYVMTEKPRSILCAPLLNQGKLIGLLYLENNLTTGAFTTDRLEVLNMLAAQAAISIENAVLYTTLEQNEEKYRTIFEDSKDAIFITTTSGTIVDMNRAGMNLFSLTEQTFRHVNIITFYADPNDRATFREAIESQGSVRDYPVRFRRADGAEIDCLITSSVRYAADGTIFGYQGIVRDITAQKRADAERAALLDQQARRAGELHAIIQSMADGLLVVDAQEYIVIVNPVAADLLGRDSSSLVAQPLDVLTREDDPVLSIGLQHIVDQIREELRAQQRTIPEQIISLGDRIVRLQSAPTLGSRGTLTGAVMVIQDITRAVEADRAKSNFIATASHEMRTPLASMKGFVDVFYLSGIENLTENQRMFLDTIKRQTDHLVLMINDLLEVARLDQGSFRAERCWVSLEQAIDDTLTNIRTRLDQREVNLGIEIEPDIPPIWIDAIHIRRILNNLISNAIKYVYAGGNVWVRAYALHDPLLLPSSPGDQPWKPRDQRSVVVEVEDNGVGIRESDQSKIFTRFFRSDNPLSVEAGGSGLGLIITQSLVHLHNGQIGFRSVENEGSCFWVRLPAPSIEPLKDGQTI